MGWFWPSREERNTADGQRQSSCPHTSSHGEGSRCPNGHADSINPDTLMPFSSKLNAPSVDGGSSQLVHTLSAEREASTIPCTPAALDIGGDKDYWKDLASGADSHPTWQYPSPRMFYNALLRKGYPTDPQDIDSMLFIHNHLNEGVWEEILKWERVSHQPFKSVVASKNGHTLQLNQLPCVTSLKRFKGRPNDLSPRARLMMMFYGAEKPFDRHDWVIDRCGKEVRYIIDYYEGNSDEHGSPTIHVDVRPAMDSVQNMNLRLKMSLNELSNKIYRSDQ